MSKDAKNPSGPDKDGAQETSHFVTEQSQTIKSARDEAGQVNDGIPGAIQASLGSGPGFYFQRHTTGQDLINNPLDVEECLGEGDQLRKVDTFQEYGTAGNIFALGGIYSAQLSK